jgi:hypothetical protein
MVIGGQKSRCRLGAPGRISQGVSGGGGLMGLQRRPQGKPGRTNRSSNFSRGCDRWISSYVLIRMQFFGVRGARCRILCGRLPTLPNHFPVCQILGGPPPNNGPNRVQTSLPFCYLFNCITLIRTAIEKLKLGYMIIPIAATPFPSIASEISHEKWIYLRWLLSRSHFDGVAAKPQISGRNCNATT